MLKLKQMTGRRGLLDVSYLPFIISAVAAVIVVNLVYGETQEILKERLRERLISIAATAALQFEASDVESIQSRDDIGKGAMANIVETMSAIRESNKNLKFIYILRHVDDGELMEFVADADSLAPLEEIDENQNQILDEEEAPPMPGDEYDGSDLPALIEAFDGQASADYELNTDQWGTFLSGYAPILNDDSEVVAVLGIDVEVSEFNVLVRATLIPFLLLSAFLLTTLLVLTIVLVRIWNNRVELVEELDRQKDELLSIVSHQLATPISSVKWYIEMMLDGDLGKITKEQQEHLNSVQSVAADLSDLCGMILDVSRIQLGRVKVEPGPLDLNEFFKEILNVIEPKANEKGVKFTVKMPTTLPTAMLDKRMTRMTIENLLSNAVKYTPKEGSVSFVVELRDHTLYCEVRDTGCGIPKKDQAQIFGKLFRASNVRNQVDGNGFGLYIAKGAIEAQGGKIWFESEENKGTTFFVELPLKTTN